MVEIIGYLASVLIAAAMLFNSILKLRWFSFLGSLLFTIYGSVIGAYPVVLVNGFIMFTNIWFIAKIYNKKENFRILEIESSNAFLQDYFKNNFKEIVKYFPSFEQNKHDISLLILRNNNIAGLFLANIEDYKLIIKLDYVSKEYRDFKPGKFIYKENKAFFTNKGIQYCIAENPSKNHIDYLSKVGFVERTTGNKVEYIKPLQ
jgi:hypothetical protein